MEAELVVANCYMYLSNLTEDSLAVQEIFIIVTNCHRVRNPFVRAQYVNLARKTGVANFIVHVAPVHIDVTESLAAWKRSILRKRQRAR